MTLNKSILITGAGGFIGSFLVAYALDHQWEVWAGVRGSTSRKWLTDPRIRFIELHYDAPAILADELRRHKQEHGSWEVIINNMGVTKCNDPRDFERINCTYVQHFIEALRATQNMPRQFVLMSSLGAFGPIHEADGECIRLTDSPKPNTAYGLSKLHIAQYVKAQADVPYTIFYPTGVYGPREKDYYLMFKTVKSGFDFIPGFQSQELTFIYVQDLVNALFCAIDKKMVSREYLISEGQSYSSTQFRKYIQTAMGKKTVIPIKVPLCILKAVNYIAGWGAHYLGKVSTLNADKYRIMAQRNWKCDITPLIQELDYTPQYSLKRGVNESYEWYKKEGWL